MGNPGSNNIPYGKPPAVPVERDTKGGGGGGGGLLMSLITVAIAIALIMSLYNARGTGIIKRPTCGCVRYE